MQQVGEKLEEARKRQGITIREASDATKIRADFLVSFEQGTFDIKLPEIYRRGFVKNYARFLNLDPDKIMIEYAAVTGTSNLSRSARRENRETLGRMDFNPSSASAKPSIRPSQGSTAPAFDGEEAKPNTPPSVGSGGSVDTSIYWKIGLITGAFLILIVLSVSLISAIAGVSEGEDPEADLDPVVANISEPSTPVAPPVASGATDIFTLIAAGEVYVIVTEIGSNEQIFKRKMAAGEEVALESKGPARISYGNASMLKVRKDGATYQAADGSYRMQTDQF